MPGAGSWPADFVTRCRASYPGPRPVWLTVHGSGGGGRKQPTLVATIQPGYRYTVPDGQLVMQKWGHLQGSSPCLMLHASRYERYSAREPAIFDPRSRRSIETRLILSRVAFVS
ncbi:hypothetical protein PISMIDRAFT_685533, partial [Pisolithus microcarpus 441]